MREGMQEARRILIAGLATFGLMGFGQALVGPALPEATRAFRLPEGEAALLISALWVGSAIGVAAMYFLSHRIAPRHALALLALGGAGLAVQPFWGAMLAAMVVFGLGYGMASATFNPRVLRAFGRRGASMVGLLNAAFAGGAIVGPLVLVWLGTGSAAIFGLTAAGCALVWILAGQPRGQAPVAAPAPRPGFRPHWPMLAFGVAGIGIEASLTGLGPTALIAAGESEARASALLSGFFVAFLAARVALGVMAHRVAPFTICLVAMAWVALGALAGALWQPGLAFVMLGVPAGLLFPGYFVTATQKMGDDPRVAPLVLLSGLAGGIGLPFLLAVAMPSIGERGFFWLLALIALPAAIAAALSLRRPMPA